MVSKFNLSIIIPVFNVEKYIEKCIKSLVGIDDLIEAVEIIVVNDGTQDSSIDIIRRYFQHFQTIRIIDQENQGLSAARNIGFQSSRGYYVYFLDSDDYIDIKSFAKLFNKALESRVDCIVGDFMYDLNGTLTYCDTHLETSNDILCDGKTFFVNYYKHIGTVVWRCIYKKDLLVNNYLNFSEGKQHEDINFSPKAYILSNKVLYTPISFYYYVTRENSIQHSSFTEKKKNSLLFVYSDLVEFCKSKDSEIQKTANSIIVISALVILGLSLVNGIYTDETRSGINKLIQNPLYADIKTKFIKAVYLLFPKLVERLLIYHYKNYSFSR